MPDEITYSIILPAYLEEENLRLLLPRLGETLRHIQEASEVIVVDTAKPLDGTKEVCAQYGARHVIRRPSDSFGDAMRTGIREARGQWLIFMDADGSHAPEFIPRLIEHSGDNDIVIASRYIEGGFTENAWIMAFMSRVLNLTYSIVLNLNVKDVSNNFKLYRAGVLKDLGLSCQNFDIVEEILFKIARAHPGVRIKEIPFSFKKRMFGQTKRSLLLFMMTYIFTIIKLRFHLR